MSFCPNCECPTCQQLKLSNDPHSKAKADALRVITKAGDLGLTKSELTKFSRPFRALFEVSREAVLNELLDEGALVKHTFPPTAGRGKSRPAFLAAQVSQ